MRNFSIPYREIALSGENILRDIGYNDSLPDRYISDTIEHLLNVISRKVRPCCSYKIYNGEVYNSQVSIQNTTLDTGATITYLLKNSTSFAVFAATAGKEFDEIIREYNKTNDILCNYILDIIGTNIVEKAGDYLEMQLEKEIAGLLHTNRFSPGYCSWHLTEQKKIFSLLDNEPCGITLSDVCLMTPIKSISGIIGIGENVNQKEYACKYCELETCYKRKK